MPYRKKLIEAALPFETINAGSAREKSIRLGHPSTLQLWRAHSIALEVFIPSFRL
jgi:putative DNA methylase